MADYNSTYTGAEIDEAVGKADKLPAATTADYGKMLMVDGESGEFTLEGLYQIDRRVNLFCEIDQNGNITTQSQIGRDVYEKLASGNCFLECDFSKNDLPYYVRMEALHGTYDDGSHGTLLFFGRYFDPFDSSVMPRTFVCVVTSVGSANITPVFAWINEPPFIVTLTPTAQNYSGVMDKTVAEINEAYEAGRKIYFRVLTGASTYAEVLCAIAVKDNALYPSYGGYTIDLNNNLFIYAYTGYTNDGTMNAYGTAVFPLTPMS